MESRGKKASRTEWTAAFLAAAELVRTGYVVSFTMGNRTPIADLMVWNPVNGDQFLVDVKGWRGRGSGWFASEKPEQAKLFYFFVLVGEERTSDRFFVLSQRGLQSLYDDYRRTHKDWDGYAAVLTRAEAAPFENGWERLPGWGLLHSN
jgi:hypothetical protein